MSLIEREAALKVLEAWPQLLEKLGVTLSPQANDMLTDCIRAIRGVKAIDAAPVVHGRWVTRHDGPYKQARKYCSACGKHSGLIKERPYCPNCGARMDGGDGHAD